MFSAPRTQIFKLAIRPTSKIAGMVWCSFDVYKLASFAYGTIRTCNLSCFNEICFKIKTNNRISISRSLSRPNSFISTRCLGFANQLLNKQLGSISLNWLKSWWLWGQISYKNSYLAAYSHGSLLSLSEK